MHSRKHNWVNTESLDGVRGVSVAIVSIFHLVAFVSTSPSPNIVGDAAVPIFFTLSGFVLELGYGRKMSAGASCATVAQFTMRRLARLYPMYLLCNLLALAAFGTRSKYGPFASPSPVDLIAWFLLLTNWVPPTLRLPPLVVSWTISSFFCLYAAFPWLARALHVLVHSSPAGGGPRSRLRAVAVCSSAVYLAGGLIALLTSNEGVYYNSGVFAIPCFLVGMCAGRQRLLDVEGNAYDDGAHAANGSSSDAVAAVIGGILLLSSAAFSIASLHHDCLLYRWSLNISIFVMPLPTYALILAVTQPGVPAGTFDARVLRSPAVRALGEVSMAVYLLHTVPLTIVDAWCGPRSSLLSVALKGVTFAAVFPASWVLTHYFERPASYAITSLSCEPLRTQPIGLQ